jgi:outer membrane lipoprotein-sorting protein
MTLRSVASAIICSLVSLNAGAAALTPEELLKHVDASVSRSTDEYFVYEMTTSEPGKPDKTLTFEVTTKGKHWRRVEFLAPGDVKGTRVLVRSPHQMYIYLPAFRKIRRVATHVKEQGFMGSAWDDDEFALATYGEVFRAVSVKEHPNYWTLVLERKPDQEFSHHTIEIDVRRDIEQPVELRYYDDKGTKVKTEQRLEFTCGGGVCAPKIVEMVDHTRADIKTRMMRKAWKVNQGVPDSFFTVRALQRGT